MTMEIFSLSGSKALITGAGTGIGEATAQRFAEAGCAALMLVGRRHDKLLAAKKAIDAMQTSCQVHIQTADISNEADRSVVKRRVLSDLGALDILVNNAGIYVETALGNTTPAAWEHVQAVNVSGAFFMTQDFIEILSASGKGSIVNISSSLGVKPILHAAAYNTSKAALIHLTKTLALELGPRNIRVNCLLPAVVETPMQRSHYDSDVEYSQNMKKLVKLHPLGRIGQPNDVAYAIVFLCSSAARWITGAALPVDGGMLCT